MAKKINVPKPTSYSDTLKFLKENAIELPNGQFRTRANLHGFKKIYSTIEVKDANSWPYTLSSTRKKTVSAIANMVIPAGTVINLSIYCKLRAEQAYCHSIVDVETRKALDDGYSGHTASFKYRSGESLGLTKKDFDSIHKDQENVESYGKASKLRKCKVSVKDFDYTTAECRAGIHFFLDLQRAINY